MDGLHIFLVVLLGVVSHSRGGISAPVLEVTVRPGDNVTLYCDCQLSTGRFIVWYRNCSHENQPPLLLRMNFLEHLKQLNYDRILPRFQFVRNSSSKSYDLLIMNITDVDEGLYYCATEERKVEDKQYITDRYEYTFGNATTRIRFNPTEANGHSSVDPHQPETPPDCAVCRLLLFTLCPALAVLSSLISSLVVHHLCYKKVKKPQVDQQKPETRGGSRLDQDEDVCYAALEIRQASQRPKRKKTQSSDFSTYSAISTSKV